MRNQKLFDERVEKEWDESGTGDGYWMQLKPGWTLDDVSAIHENTRAKCLARLPECKFDSNHPSWK